MTKYWRAVAATPLLILAACSSATDVTEPPQPTSTASQTTAPTVSSATQPTRSNTPTSTTPTSQSTPTSTPRPLDAPPKVGDCFNVPAGDFATGRDSSELAVPCTQRHTGETFAVFDVGPEATGREIAEKLRRCSTRFRSYVGGPDTTSRLGVTMLGPSVRQAQAGATWVRCDVVNRQYFNTDLGKPVTRSYRGALEDGVPDSLIACADKLPTPTKPVKLSGCGNRHTAQLIPEALVLGGPQAKYPGQAEVRQRANRFCRRTFQKYVPSTYSFYTYSPTAESWRAGTHATTCWARSESPKGLPPA